MKQLLILSIFVFLFLIVESRYRSRDEGLMSELCDTLSCDSYEECDVTDGIARCVCKSQCLELDNPVCGSNGKVYATRCHLQREICRNGETVRLMPFSHCANRSAQLPTDGSHPIAQLLYRSMEGEMPPPHHDDVIVKSTTTVATLFDSDTEETTTGTRLCNEEQMDILLADLLLLYRNKLEIQSTNRTEIVTELFQTIDHNNDGEITPGETERVTELWNIQELPSACGLDAIFEFHDDNDFSVNLNEFLTSYGLQQKIEEFSLEVPKEDVVIHTVEVGDQYQIICSADMDNDTKHNVIWKRFGKVVTPYEGSHIKIESNGMLYLANAAFIHQGNFTCECDNSQNVQIHVISVSEKLLVKIEPNYELVVVGDAVALRCNVETGYPLSSLQWHKNGQELQDNGYTLVIKSAMLNDTGTYTCKATRGQHRSESVATLVVRTKFELDEELALHDLLEPKERLTILYDKGLITYDIESCEVRSSMLGTAAVDDGHMCNIGKDYLCDWSAAVVTRPINYMYLAMESEQAVVVVDTAMGFIKHVIKLDHKPFALHYIKSYDVVWVEAWTDDSKEARQFYIIRDATKGVHHDAEKSITGTALFVPEVGEFGYVSHRFQLGLEKISLKDASSITMSDFHNQNCHPVSMSFAGKIGEGYIGCMDIATGEANGYLVIDLLTDTVLSKSSMVSGRPMVTPDFQMMVNLENNPGRLTLYNTTQFTTGKVVDVSSEILDYEFFPSLSNQQNYDLYLLTTKPKAVKKINLDSGLISDLHVLKDQNIRHKSIGGKIMLTSKTNGHNVAVANIDSVSIINVITGGIQCQLEMSQPSVLLWT